MHVLAIDGSPEGSGRTAAVLTRVLDAARQQGAATELLSLAQAGGPPFDTLIERITAADALVLGSPIYRASFAYPLKVLLDHLPRGMWGESLAPLKGKAVCIVATGASLHHFLALGDLRNVLAAFFAAHVVPPGLYLPREGFAEDGSLRPPYANQAEQAARPAHCRLPHQGDSDHTSLSPVRPIRANTESREAQ